ncbi:FtsX-like permease family protein [Dactylosporangium sp. NPDC049140]|uniref:FtsX-like permease family protein n=1 Tax=Dactylosporangium sp. NPDC049140 TaxID=3155647 RepID=UPI00340247B9
MAVVVSNASGPGPRILAVDSPRLRAVAAADPGPAIARLHPPAPAPVAVTGTTLALRAAGGGPVALGMTLAVTGTGDVVHADFGAIGGDGEYRAEVPVCADGCRLVALDLRGDPGATLDLLELRAGGRVVVDGAGFADPARWRAAAGDAVTGVQRLRGDGRMRLAAVATPDGEPADRHIYAIDAPLPLPLLATPGAVRDPDRSGTAELALGGAPVPVRAETADALPARSGGVILVDLESADRLAGPPSATDVDQVWLAAGAPPGLVDRLTAAGLTVIGGDSVAADRDRLARLGPAAALRFHLLAAVLMLLLASAALTVVAAVQRRERQAEVGVLRRQGVPARALRAAARWSALAPVALALAIGLVAAAAARWLLRSPVRPFTDGWAVDEPAVTVPALLVALAAATVGFTAAALGSGRTGGPR